MARRALFDADWAEARRRLVFDGPSRVVDVGDERRRLFPPSGGPTVQTNGRAACGFHNRNRRRQPQRP